MKILKKLIKMIPFLHAIQPKAQKKYVNITGKKR
jgi:hypothetical protein